MTLRSRVHDVLDGSGNRAARVVRFSLALLIVANVLAVVFETVPAFAERAGGLLDAFEAVSLAVFSVEYLLRLWSAGEHAAFRGAPGRLYWMATPGALVDLLAIAPSLLALGGDMRVVRVLRLARLMRIAKLGRYSFALRTLREVVQKKAPDLLSMAFVLLILLVLSSALMFQLEHEAQPEAFSSIPATMWWGIVTLTTIGYGDMSPITIEGRLVGAFVAVLGIGMFALPAGLLGSAFVDELGKARDRAPGGAGRRCPHCDGPL